MLQGKGQSAGSAEASGASPRCPGPYIIKDESAHVNKSATFIRSLPRTRISESLEALHETLDSSLQVNGKVLVT